MERPQPQLRPPRLQLVSDCKPTPCTSILRDRKRLDVSTRRAIEVRAICKHCNSFRHPSRFAVTTTSMAHDIGCQHRHAAAVALQTHSELRAFALCHQDRRGSACTLSTAQPRARGSYRGGALLGILAKMPELLTPPSAVVLNERKFPVITENPTWSQICTCLATASHNEPWVRS